MWGMRTETIPVIIGALGAIKKELETYLGSIPGQLSPHGDSVCRPPDRGGLFIGDCL